MQSVISFLSRYLWLLEKFGIVETGKNKEKIGWQCVPHFEYVFVILLQ